MPNFDINDNKTVNTTSTNTNTNASQRAGDEAVKDMHDELRANRTSLLSQTGRRYQTSALNQNLEQVDSGLRNTITNSFPELAKEFEIIKVTNEALRYPAVVVASKFVANNQQQVAYFYFPIQDRVTALEVKTRGGDERRAVPPVPTDVIDGKFEATVEDAVIRHYSAINGGKAIITHMAGQQIIGDLFTLDQKENQEGYIKIFIAAVGQVDALRMKVQGDKSGIICKQMIAADSVVVGRIDYTPSIALDIVNNPHRSDINLTIVETKRNSRNGERGRRDESHNGEAGLGSTLIEVDASVNFIFIDQQQREYSRDRREDLPQKFMPEIRINKIDCRLNPSIANFMYGIASIAAVAQGERWVQAFAPKAIRKKLLRDLGGLYAEQPEPGDASEPVSTVDGTMEDVYKLARRCTTEDVMITFLAHETSEYSRITDQLYIMATSDIGSDVYNDAYDDMMSELTVMIGRPLNWDERTPIFLQEQVHRTTTGHYQNGSQNLSTDDIDYVSIINNGSGLRPMATAQEWDESFGKMDYDEGTKVRANIIIEETDQEVCWTGAHSTISIAMPFLNMLKEEFDNAGVGIEIDSMEDNSGRHTRRHASSFTKYAGTATGYSRHRSDNGSRGRRSQGGRRGR